MVCRGAKKNVGTVAQILDLFCQFISTAT